MRGYVMSVLVVVFYAGNILTGRALNDLPPATIAFFRLVIALGVLLPLGLSSAWRSREVFRQHARPLLLMTVTGVAFFNTFLYAALGFTSATNVSVLEATIPALTAVLGTWVLRERLRPVQWSGVAVSLVGAVWVALAGGTKSVGSWDWGPGQALMALAVMCWAVYSIAVRRYMHLFPHYGAVLVMTGISVLLLFPLMVTEWAVLGSVPTLSAQHWWGLLYLGVFPSAVALILYNRAVALLGAARASVFLNFLPVFTMAGAYLLLGETISLIQVLGAALVIVGVLFTTRASPATVRG